MREYLSVLDADWCASDRPLVACSDGSLRVFDLALQQCNSPLTDYSQESVPCPLLMPRSSFQAVKTGLQLNLVATDTDEECSDFYKRQIANLLANHSTGSTGTPSLPEQCFRAALHCGDHLQADLWTVANYYLNLHAGRECVVALDTVYDLLCDGTSYRAMAAERAALYQSKPRAYEHTRQLTRDLLLLNDKDKAIALLLNTEQEHSHFYSNHLLACLAAILQPTGCNGNAHSTLKLVATHLIASGCTWQGVEILILNGQVLDACRYLQSNNFWEDSARVAKLLLMDRERSSSNSFINTEATQSEVTDGTDIWQRWAAHLTNNKLKFAATLVLIAVGSWHKAAELLIQQQMHDAAALLLRSAEQMNLHQAKDATQLDFMVT